MNKMSQFKHSIFFLCCFITDILEEKPVMAQTSTGIIHGWVLNEKNEPVPNATILIENTETGVNSIADGSFSITNLKPGIYRLKITSLSYSPEGIDALVEAGKTTELTFHLKVAVNMLENIMVHGHLEVAEIKQLSGVEESYVIGSKKNEVIDLNRIDGNLATNNPRQIFAKVPGMNIWELDGSGIQTNIALRGLNPTRSWEFINGVNGYHINVDLYGYPEAYFTPQLHGVDRIEVISGSAALQYGPQFGGVVNYVLKEGDTTRRFSLETQQSIGSNFMFSSYNGVGGKVGKFQYYGFVDFRRSNGFRKYDDYMLTNFYGSVKYQLAPGMTLSAQFSRLYYVMGLAGGLTDSMFNEDPYQASRTRNYFNPNINVPALVFNWKMTPYTNLNVKAWSIIGQRNSVQRLGFPQIGDTINAITNDYNLRQVDRDHYKNFSLEARFLTEYILIKSHRSIFSGGIKVFDSNTHRQQLGQGTTATDFDLSVIGTYPTDLNYFTNDIAFFAENLFVISPRFTISPGARLELLKTQYEGEHLGNEYNIASTRKVRTIPLLGAGVEYKFSDRFQLYGNFSQAYRPILYSDLIPTATIAIVDQEMKDASGYNADIGIRGNIKDFLNFDLSPFLLYYANRIALLTLINDSGTTYLYKTNVGASLAIGIEAFAELHPLRLAQSNTKSDVSLFVSLAYDHANYIKGTGVSGSGSAVNNIDITGNHLEFAPEFISRSGITYTYKGLSTTFQHSYVGESYADANNTEFSSNGVTGIVPSYHLFDVSFSYYFMERYNIRGGINNLSDKAYFTRRLAAYPGPGIVPSDRRTFFVSVGSIF